MAIGRDAPRCGNHDPPPRDAENLRHFRRPGVFAAMMAGFTGPGHIPTVFAFLAIMAELLGGIGLILGLLTRIAAFGVLCNMVVGALLVNLPNGLFMNWTGRQKGEGFEFHILAIALVIEVMTKGAGPVSMDKVISK